MALLNADIQTQFAKTARQLAQVDAARALRAGTVKVEGLAGFESMRNADHLQRFEDSFRRTGELPSGFAADVADLSPLPSLGEITVTGWGL